MEKIKKAYLFSFVYWAYSPPKYILVYAEDEEQARDLACNKLTYNSGEKALKRDVILETINL